MLEFMLFVTRVTFATTFMGYAETVIFCVDEDGTYALIESKNLQIAGWNTCFFRKKTLSKNRLVIGGRFFMLSFLLRLERGLSYLYLQILVVVN